MALNLPGHSGCHRCPADWDVQQPGAVARACDNAWSDIDVQLKRRHDLIPNLVETVKGYATHEKGTFENIAKLRSQAMQATTPGDKAEAENQLTRRDEEPVCGGGKLS